VTARPAAAAPAGVQADLDFLSGLEDVSCAVSDILRRTGTGGALGLPAIFPPGTQVRACGPAFTVRYETRRADPAAPPADDGAADFDFRALFAAARPGDVAVFECPPPGRAGPRAVLGATAASWARQAGLAGCVVAGAVRDVEALAAGPLPVWASQVTPVAGRGTLTRAAVGGPVLLGDVLVRPADIVVADGNGVAIIPAGDLRTVTRLVAELHQADARRAAPAAP
jgi:4-hydroxy-4-methyl-2-oxoglutarate aldolase